MSDQAEIRVIEEFKKIFNAFPEGKILKCESPDFIVETLSGTIGVEISEVFQDSHKGKSILQERASISSRFAEDLIQKIQSQLPFTFTIVVQLSNSNFIKKQEREDLLNEITILCVNALSQAKNKEFIKIEGFRILPKEIDRIYLCR
jgi:aspartate carbamoyltransferase regulatory subunit